MNKAPVYPKRLIEIDLPIKKISAYARQEKDSRLSPIPALHIYPAARPLAACRAVMAAMLWPDPGHQSCPGQFRDSAASALRRFAAAAVKSRHTSEVLGPDFSFWNELAECSTIGDPLSIRQELLRFVTCLSNPDAEDDELILACARELTSLAASVLSGTESPIVMDPFAGGGAIPLEAARIGAASIAGDLNPIAVTINKLIIEQIPKRGRAIVEHIESWLATATERTKRDLALFYPQHSDGSQPIAYLWARTVLSEAPEGGNVPVEIPLLRSMWLARKKSRAVVLRWKRDASGVVVTRAVHRSYVDGTTLEVRQPLFEVVSPKGRTDVEPGTCKRMAATCPVTGYTTPARRVESQLKRRKGGAQDARLYCVVVDTPAGERQFRLPTESDVTAASAAAVRLHELNLRHTEALSLVPGEFLPIMSGVFNAPIYGHDNWGYLFAPRQALALVHYARYVREYLATINDVELRRGVALALGLVLDRLADLNGSLCAWQLNTANVAHLFVRWALPMVVDFGEVNPIAGAGGSPESAVRRAKACIEKLLRANYNSGEVVHSSATDFPFPDDFADYLFTDPPYYNAIPYADLMDFFYVWLRRSIGSEFTDLFSTDLIPKSAELCEMSGWDPVRYAHKDRAFFEQGMTRALARARECVKPSGLGIIVFAHKSTAGWESLLQAVINAGWIVTASWPIDTEMGSRLRAQNSAVLASSIHLVCRPRENSDGGLHVDEVGDWRAVLSELPGKIRDWLPRLAEEGVVGADAIFACLGPALEIFSRYSRVERASGELVLLKEYLEHIWAAVAKEALAMVFSGADTTGFEEDARLTAMWLWTLFAGGENGTSGQSGEIEIEGDDEEEATKGKLGGFVLEYDAARKIAQGLGAHLEQLTSLIQVKGSIARLIPVAERTRSLFRKGETTTPVGHSKSKKKSGQLSMGFLADLEEAEENGGWGDTGAPQKGQTVLDRVHQSMILFGAGRGEALKRFLVDDGVGRDDRFWQLSQAFSALYPSSTDEKRWVDGVLARKKGLGF